MRWTAEELLEEVLVAPRKAYFRFAGLEVIEREGWSQLLCPAFTRGGFNEVSRAVLSEEDADRTISATIAQYRSRDLRFRWYVGPDSAPADLAERLECHGLVRTWVRGMALELTAPVPDSGRRLQLTAVGDEREADLFTDVMARGWELDPGPLRELHRALARGADPRQRLFLAFRGGEPAGVASYVALTRSAYLMGAVVLPEHRGHGVYRALIDVRLNDAIARGLTLATTQAMESTSAPILERLGFSTVVRLPSFRG